MSLEEEILSVRSNGPHRPKRDRRGQCKNQFPHDLVSFE
jgi:hypothetical protein